MIGVDSNVLARAFLKDDLKQSPQAQKLIAKLAVKGGCFVAYLSVAELGWILASAGWQRGDVAEALERLLHTDGIEVGNASWVHRALQDFKKGPADLADYLIAAEAEAQRCETVYTFDRKFGKDPRATWLLAKRR